MTANELKELKALIEDLKKQKEEPVEIQELTQKKLKQETDKTRWVVPILQAVTPLCALFITYQVAFKTNLLDAKNTLNQAAAKENLASSELANKELENKKQLILIDTYNQTKRKDILDSQNNILRIKNESLERTNVDLTDLNNKLGIETKNSQRSVNEILKQKTLLSGKLIEANHGFDSLRREYRDFSQFDHDLYTIKNYPERDNPSVSNLIIALQNRNRYTSRIIDSLLGLRFKKNPYLPGLCSYILYFGTHDIQFKDDIIYRLHKEFDSSKKSAMNYSEILTSYRWTSADRLVFTKILFDLLKPTSSLNDRIVILSQVARFQNVFEDFNLEHIDFDLYLKYLQYCKATLNADYENSTTNNIIVENIAIICPQIFISERYLILRSSFNSVSKTGLDSTKAELINTTMFYTLMFNEDDLRDKISKKYPKLYKEIHEEEAKKAYFSFYKRNKSIFEFWDNVLYGKKPVDIALLKRKILSNEM